MDERVSRWSVRQFLCWYNIIRRIVRRCTLSVDSEMTVMTEFEKDILKRTVGAGLYNYTANLQNSHKRTMFMLAKSKDDIDVFWYKYLETDQELPT